MADDGRWSSSLLGNQQLAGNTLPENYSAIALLQQLDHAWFQDNLLKPRVGLINAFMPSASSPLSPYQSIELVDAAHSKWASPVSHHPHHGEMPCARFEALSCGRRALTSPQIFHKNLLEGSKNIVQCDPQPPQPPQVTSPHAVAACPLVSQWHICSNTLADTVLVPPSALQSWVAKDLKDSHTNENSRARKLESIESGKQLRAPLVDAQLPQPVFRTKRAQKDRRKNSKSMTALEFDELQGFKDLGFHFGQDELTPRIVRMLPALRHKLAEEGDFGRIRRAISTEPKQSSLEAWLVRRSAAPLRDWQTPATREDMNKHLKFWARAVASTVRQEC